MAGKPDRPVFVAPVAGAKTPSAAPGLGDSLRTDRDGDGLTDAEERIRGTDPDDADTDNDSVSDGAEVAQRTDPNVSGLTRTGEVDLPLVEQEESDTGDLFGNIADALDDAQAIPDNQALADADGDGLNAIDESFLGTDPDDADSDNDKISDGDEAEQGTNPLAADTDGDGLTDLQEQRRGTDPLSSDTDRDGISDADDRFATIDTRAEVEAGLAPPVLDNGPPPPPPVSAIDADEITGNDVRAIPTLEGVLEQDRDGDGLSDAQERILGTDPDDVDTDDDLVSDGVEVADKSDPTVREFDLEVPGLPTFDNRPPAESPLDNVLDDLENVGIPGDVSQQINRDSDGDGLSDISELTGDSNPNDADSDDDGLNDGREAQLGTNPRSSDTDGDGVGDRREVKRGTDPTNADTDGDGQSDLVDLIPTVASSTLSNDLENGLASPTIDADPVPASRPGRRARREAREEDDERPSRETAARDQIGTVATETPITDGSSNTITLDEERPSRETAARDQIGTIATETPITDGSSNTITLDEQLSRDVDPPDGTQSGSLGGIRDGASNTIDLGEQPANERTDDEPAADPVKRPDPTPPPAEDGPTQEAASNGTGDQLVVGRGPGLATPAPSEGEESPAVEVIDDDRDEQFGTGRTTDPVAERTFEPPAPQEDPPEPETAAEVEDDEFAFGDGRAPTAPEGADATSPPTEAAPDASSSTEAENDFLPPDDTPDDEDDDDEPLEIA